MAYTYSMGKFRFRISGSGENWTLFVNNEACGTYSSPVQAADDVGSKVTGHSGYDLSKVWASGELEDWNEE